MQGDTGCLGSEGVEDVFALGVASPLLGSAGPIGVLQLGFLLPLRTRRLALALHLRSALRFLPIVPKMVEYPIRSCPI